MFHHIQHVLPNVRDNLFSNAFPSLISLLPGMMLTSVEESGKHLPCMFVCTYYAPLFCVFVSPALSLYDILHLFVFA